MASLAGVVAATLFRCGLSRLGWAIAAALGVGVAGGLLNGFLVSILGILPFVATLGTMTVFGGLAFVRLGQGRTIFGRDIPPSFSGFARSGLELGELAHPGADPRGRWRFWRPYGWCWSRRPTVAASMPSEAISRPRGWQAQRCETPAVARLHFHRHGGGHRGAHVRLPRGLGEPTQGDGLMLAAIACVFLGMTMSEEGEPRVLGTLLGRFAAGAFSTTG